MQIRWFTAHGTHPFLPANQNLPAAQPWGLASVRLQFQIANRLADFLRLRLKIGGKHIKPATGDTPEDNQHKQEPEKAWHDILSIPPQALGCPIYSRTPYGRLRPDAGQPEISFNLLLHAKVKDDMVNMQPA